ncbi:hypothetical protein Slin15195_G072390 [Septoria linicola]|uniref:Uncharacterized protein n=1 Tax=Septoria linicola TaxID=215465 RepID=A0A9Q9AWQ7_9PEZI|nr:hypothetical protein Slin14017_G105130 [Septoria linicola]USW53920.1 hypothetical protein Slin15195_G072390 [Septoria linicola]
MRGRHPPRSPSVESFTEKFKAWNTSLSNIQIRASLVHKAGLRPVYEKREDRPIRYNYSKSTTTLHECAKDSAVDLGELRERYTSGDRIFNEHEQNSQRHQKSRDRSRSRVCVSSRASTQSEFDYDAQFLERVEAARKGSKTRPASSAGRTESRQSDQRTLRNAKSLPRMAVKAEKALPPLPGAEVPPPGRRTFMESIKSARHLRNMRSLSHLKVPVYVNPHESMDFRCVGSPVEAINAFEEVELQNERDDLLRSINLSRARMCNRNTHNLLRSAHLDREAQEAASDLDKFESVPAGSTFTMDELTSTAQLIGPAGFPGLATGERWASIQYKHQSHTKPVCKLSVNVVKSATCPCHNYTMFAAITDESWRYIGMARTAVDRRWVVLLSASTSDNDDAKSTRSLLTPASSIRKSRSKSRLRRTEEPPPLPITYGTLTPCHSDDEEDLPARPVFVW